MSMEINLSYFLHSSIAIAVFYLAYILLFTKEKIFLFNRFYLLMSMIISFIIPLITFREKRMLSEVIIPEQLFQSITPTQPTSLALAPPVYNWQPILAILFIGGFVFFLIVLIIGHVKVWRLVHTTSKQTLYGHSVRITTKNIPPFAYFGKLIIPSGYLNSPHLQSVVCHERIHAKEQHCIDLCFAEFLFLFQWFNPFAWLMKKAIRDNLEFLTDNEAINHIDKQEYQLSMVSLSSNNTISYFPSISSHNSSL